MTGYRIRLARPEDAEAFHLVEEDAASLLREEPSLKGSVIPPTASVAEHARIIAKGRSLAALDGERIVGFAAIGVVGRELHLAELSVARRHQRCGVGSLLLRAAMIDARNSGYRAITLNTYRDIAWNAPFYARFGFVEVENFEGRRHLQESNEGAQALGLPMDRRCAMICFLD
ncbi:MAG: GNAT family N-acetyltransferase [Erythrobacter sp.]|jgi:predicted N-acetyltransferase YhbS|nr:GNAT family N-acetyltransferase [Erythrobacter sp.]